HRDLAFPSHRPCLSAPRGHLQTLPIPPVLHSLPTRRSSDLTLATLAISGDGASTRLLGEVTTAAWPRHLSVAGEYVLVAGENADEVAVHPVTNGQAGEATDRIAVPGPMCVLPM